MVEIYLYMLRNGSDNVQVGTLQILLNAYGYRDADGDPLVVDNDFGSATEYAVRNFQRDNGLRADGIVGFNTWSTLLNQ